MAVKIHKPSENGLGDSLPSPQTPLRPLAISGVCVTKAALIDALRLYLPGLLNIEVVEDGERFLLSVGSPPTASPEEGGVE